MPLVSVHVRPGRWAAETNVSTSGAMLRWLRDLTGRGYAELESLAGESPLGARGAMLCAANPQWGAEDWAQVPPISLVGASPSLGVGDVARAVLESSAHAIACNLARLDSLNDAPGEGVLLTGGGSTPFAAQLLADVLGRRVEVPELEHAAAVGGALLVAGLDRPPVAPGTHAYEPGAERHAAYAPHTRRYAETFGRLGRASLGAAG
jgi:sugar (pentulose or hexulose) kinase